MKMQIVAITFATLALIASAEQRNTGSLSAKEVQGVPVKELPPTPANEVAPAHGAILAANSVTIDGEAGLKLLVLLTGDKDTNLTIRAKDICVHTTTGDRRTSWKCTKFFACAKTKASVSFTSIKMGDYFTMVNWMDENAEVVFEFVTGRKNIATLIFPGVAKSQAASLHLGSLAAIEIPNLIQDAAMDGDLPRVKALLKECPTLISCTNRFEQTALHFASLGGSKEVTEFLLASKADVDAKDDEGYTPLHNAATRDNRVVAELLLANRANVNAVSQSGATPLHLAAASASKDFVALLLTNKADVNAKDKAGETPLQKAVKVGHKEVAEELRKNGGKE